MFKTDGQAVPGIGRYVEAVHRFGIGQPRIGHSPQMPPTVGDLILNDEQGISVRRRGGPPTAVDLFAGALALSLGLKNAGFEVLVANEERPDPCKTS